MDKSHKKKRISIVGSIVLTAIVLLVVAVIFALTREQITTTGEYPNPVSDRSLTCNSNNIDYPFFTYDNATHKGAEIDIIFAQNKMKSIALVYNLYYNDMEAITASEAHNHAAMNKSFAASGLGEADAYNAKYAKLSDRMQMNLYTTTTDFDNVATKYFLLDSDAGMPQTIDDYQRAYQSRGFNCQINNN